MRLTPADPMADALREVAPGLRLSTEEFSGTQEVGLSIGIVLGRQHRVAREAVEEGGHEYVQRLVGRSLDEIREEAVHGLGLQYLIDGAVTAAEERAAKSFDKMAAKALEAAADRSRGRASILRNESAQWAKAARIMRREEPGL